MKFERVTARRLKCKLRLSGRVGLALDIDDTLSYTDYHWFEQMMLFDNPESLSREELIKKYGRVRNVPFWQTQRAKNHFKKLLHSNYFQGTIPLIQDSNHIVQKINKIIPIVAYITARPVSVRESTRKWLEEHGFPDAPLVFRPLNTSIERKNLWKANLLKFLYPEVMGIIDDHPLLKKELRELKYKGLLFLYDSGKNVKKYHHRSVRFRDWPSILEKVSNLTLK